ncbi:VOC family protein [Nesterenkonia sp. PF2B19]|uniref:VOC family protein n=1 Tax=unclassified Nesterenkonia TaxID=2629769 RepID=UPI000892D33C|nr:VOC family protein [Nesterenkonia sp. PF2B19]OSM43089.1 hypothetical protein BCY76_010330 [Nesterenkonia sp. PF2B19]
MTLCLPFLMFQGQAQEAIDLYLETFPDAELIEIQHHPEGTEIFDAGNGDEDEVAEVEEDTASEEHEGAPADETDLDADDDTDDEGGVEHDDAEGTAPDEGDTSAGDGAVTPTDEDPSPATGTDLTTVDAEATPAAPTRLVATAQVLVGGQVLMIQDSLVRHEFSFTPSVSVAVVVDTTTEFDEIVEKLSEGGSFLMEPGDYDFAKNFAWVQDRFGMSWQVNHPLTAPDENIAQAQAPDWG